ncbi:MAG: murein biosynthesis integral membrane protein MurJ [Clostridia bacterium]|nr:murein biosynthesis integral membrane protein MurJ [Clostridia bacterium]
MKKKNLFGAIGYVTVIMIFSRLLALVSTQVYMSFYGASDLYLNIYSYAISIPNIIFTCFGTALSTVVIPIYTGYIATEKREKAKSFADTLITVTTVFTALLVLVGIALSPILPRFTSLGDYGFAVRALMIMMPAMLFYGLNYIFQGMLQSHGKYGWPAFVSVPSSLVVILYVIFLGDTYGVSGLLVATLIGLSLQAFILVPPLVRTGYRYKASFDLKNPDMRVALRMTLPVLLGVSAYQMNMFYNTTMIANFPGMVTLLTFVQNITLYLVLAFAYSITAVIYPRLTAYAAVDDMDSYKETLRKILNSVILLLVPVTFGFIAVRQELLQLISQWGKVTSSDIDAAAGLLCMYSIGILGIGMKEILDRAFYALKKTFLPAVNGFVIMAVNIVLSQILMRKMGANGIPLAYSVASLTGTAVLLFALRRKIGPYGKGIGTTFIKSIFAAAVMFVCVLFLNRVLGNALPGNTLLFRLVRLGVPCMAGVLIYGILALILGLLPKRGGKTA